MVKTDDAKGEAGAWATHARAAAGLTVEQVAAATNYTVSSIRKLEGGSAPMSRPMREALWPFYVAAAAKLGRKVIDPPPARASGGLSPLVEAAIERAVARGVEKAFLRFDARARGRPPAQPRG